MNGCIAIGGDPSSSYGGEKYNGLSRIPALARARSFRLPRIFNLIARDGKS